MLSNDFFHEIEQMLPSEESAQVLISLRQDLLVWQALEQPDFFHVALEKAGSQVVCWSPGRLALLALEDPRPADTLRAEPMPALGQALQERALQAYQATQRTMKPPATLREAGFLALALRERRRLTGTWSGLLQELLPKQAGSDTAANLATVFSTWRTPLACLYGLVPDPEEMLRSLMPKTPTRIPFDWVVTAQLSQPLTETEHIKAFTRILQGLSVSFQLNLLRSLSLRGASKMAAALADQLLVGHPAFAALRTQTRPNDLDIASLASRAMALQQMGAFYQLSGDTAQATALYRSVEATLGQWLSGLALQRLDLQIEKTDLEPLTLCCKEEISQLANEAGWLKNELGAVLLSHPYGSSVLDEMQEDGESSFLQLKRAMQMAEQEPAISRDLARQAVARLIEEIDQNGMPFTGDFVYTWRPEDAVKVLISLKLIDEARSLTHALLKIRPADIQLLHTLSDIEEQEGKIDQAILVLRNIVSLEPKCADWRRQLGALWTQAHQYEQALDEWQTVLSFSEAPSIEDRQACAQAAMRAGKLDRTVELCEQILKEDANQGATLGLLGQALEARGDARQALPHLVRATMLSPEMIESWLALARAQEKLDDGQRVLETLRSAVTAVPDSGEGHFELGKVCVKRGMLSEALPHLRKAFQLNPNSDSTALMYAQTLRIMGHTAETRSVLEQTRSRWNQCPELAYEFAQVLLDSKDAEAALPVLETALQNGLPVLDGYLLYAKVLLGEYRSGNEAWDADGLEQRMEHADRALKHILEVSPDHLEARFLAADILRERGRYTEALIAYQDLSESSVAGETELRWRIQWGLGQTAMLLDRNEIALAALREACQEKPENLEMCRCLAEVSLKASLIQEAMETAESIYRTAPDHVENLIWFANFTSRAGESQRSAEALERAVQLSPARSDLRVDLAINRLTAGDLTAARNGLKQVLDLESASRDDLRRAGQVYLRMQDPQAALECFERALTVEPPAPLDLLYETAQLHEQLGHMDTALELAQQAQVDTPESLPVHLLQADLLVRLSRPQAALAVLERALAVAKNALTHNLPEKLDLNHFLEEIHNRFTKLMIEAGDLTSAFHHAEESLALNPGNAELCGRAAELALAQLQSDQAARIIQPLLQDEHASTEALLSQGKEGLNVLILDIEMELDARQDEEAKQRMRSLPSGALEEPRMQAVRARLAAREDDFSSAKQLSELARSTAGDQETGNWLLEAAVEAQNWTAALEMAERNAKARPSEARAQLSLARVLVLSAERQRMCAAVNCQTNAPGEDVLDEMHQARFEEAISAAGRLARVGEIGRWQARGQAVFTPSIQTVRTLAAIPSGVDDVAALIGALRQINNLAAAAQVARRYIEHPAVLLQLALCHLNRPSDEGIAVARKAAAANPNHPVAHALLASLLNRMQQSTEALQEFEKALEIYPNEPVWHDAAADLGLSIGNTAASVEHRKEARHLDPNNASYALKLGQAYLAKGDLAGAIEHLEKSTLLNPEQPEEWLALASAYHLADRLPQAMAAAKKASELNSTSAEGLLIAGETALAMNYPEQALEFAQNAIEREPENPGAILFLSSVLKLQGQVEKSLNVLEQSAPDVRSSFPVAFERVKLVNKLHGAQAAVELLNRLVNEYPDEPELLGFYAQVMAESGDIKTAERVAFKALRLDPNQPELTMMLGLLERKSGQLDQAVHLLTEAIHMSPEKLQGYLELGSVYQERREYAQAISTYKEAMRIAPNDYQAFYQCGLILRDSKDYSGAEKMLRRAAELAPDNLIIRRQLVAVIALNLVHHTQEVSVP